jgi:hypothetical protein
MIQIFIERAATQRALLENMISFNEELLLKYTFVYVGFDCKSL